MSLVSWLDSDKIWNLNRGFIIRRLTIIRLNIRGLIIFGLIIGGLIIIRLINGELIIIRLIISRLARYRLERIELETIALVIKAFNCILLIRRKLIDLQAIFLKFLCGILLHVWLKQTRQIFWKQFIDFFLALIFIDVIANRAMKIKKVNNLLVLLMTFANILWWLLTEPLGFALISELFKSTLFL